MGLWERLMSLFSSAVGATIRLDGSSENALVTSLTRLSPAQTGWITINEARRLFSSDPDSVTSLGEYDRDGILALGSFAANYRVTPRKEGDRVYFTR